MFTFYLSKSYAFFYNSLQSLFLFNNARIQGSAADLIKKAMIQINEITNTNCKLILQIHDELVFEIKNELIEEYSQKIKDIMENAIKLSVPLCVNSKNFS